MGFLDRLREGLSRTKQQIVSRFDEIVQQADSAEQRTRPVDVDTIEALEELLVSADIGIDATEISKSGGGKVSSAWATRPASSASRTS